jgi:hypothetical protein
MSSVKTSGLSRSDKLAGIAENIWDLLERESSATTQPESAVQLENVGDQAANDLLSLVHQTSENAARGIDHLIDDLRRLQNKLADDGEHVRSAIAEYALLSQSTNQLTTIVSDGVNQVEKVSDAPNIINWEATRPAAASPRQTAMNERGGTTVL